MKRSIFLLAGITALFSLSANQHPHYRGALAGPTFVAGDTAQENAPAEKLVYADFERVQDGRPVSSRGGFIQLTSYQESSARPSRVKGAADLTPAAPELVRLQKDSPNRAAAFDYELQGLNEYAGAGIDVHGLPDKDGKPVADDVSGFKFLSLQVYATGVQSLRAEFLSQGQGIAIPSGSPQMTFRLQSGFNTYRIPLKSIAQPDWATVKVNPKDLLKKLTAINLSAFCGSCTPIKGTIVVDNMVFEK